VWRCEWNAFLGSRPFYPQNSAPAGFFVPSFGDKTGDKTPFFPSPRMAESIAVLDAPREPKDGFELPVPRAMQERLKATSGESDANLTFGGAHEAGLPTS
jgi:hypothetical protein